MIEIITRPATSFRLAAIDFDGTMSLIRIGWQHVMHGVMKAALLPYFPSPATIDTEIFGYIARSTGQPSIIQMAWVDEQVIMHGGPAYGAQHYLDQFSAALRAQIDAKVDTIHDDISADAVMVPGARAFLQLLRDHGIHIALVSGTEHHHLIRESAALRIDQFFDAGIYGPGHHDPGFTKSDAIDRLCQRLHIPAGALLSVGDGPVEIHAGKALAGYSLAVASHEVSGGLDLHKREHLIAAGADAVIAHFRELNEIKALLFSQG